MVLFTAAPLLQIECCWVVKPLSGDLEPFAPVHVVESQITSDFRQLAMFLTGYFVRRPVNLQAAQLELARRERPPLRPPVKAGP
jgi:hypothetical protein